MSAGDSFHTAQEIEHQISTTLSTARIVQRGDRGIIGFSTGSDSTALLLLLHRLPLDLNLIAVYVDHGLRPLETPREIHHATALCERLQVPLQVLKTNVREICRQKNLSIEEGARLERYRLLTRVKDQHGAKWIAVGHTEDDQVEEFFLRLLRGTGVPGISGMRFVRDDIIRPLLGISKKRLESYLCGLGVKWCEDSSNRDRTYLRNRIRHDLLPLLESDYGPGARRHILRLMQILSAENELVQQQAEEAFSRCVRLTTPQNRSGHVAGNHPGDISVDVASFRSLHHALQRRVLEKAFWAAGTPPRFDHVEQVRILLTGPPRNTSVELHFSGGVRGIYDGGRFRLCTPLPPGIVRGSLREHQNPPTYSFCLEKLENTEFPTDIGPLQIQLKGLEHTGFDTVPPQTPNVLLLDPEEIHLPLIIRPFTPGERFHPCNRPGKKKISRFFNEVSLPHALRQSWPILADQRGIVAVAGLEIDERVKITSSTKTVMRITLSRPEKGDAW